MDKTKVQNRDITLIVKGAGVVFAGTLIGSVFRYLFHVVAARGLGPELFGLFFIGFAIFRVAQMVAEFGLPVGVVRYIAIFLKNSRSRLIKGTIVISIKYGIFFSLIIATILILFSGSFANYVFKNPPVNSVIKLFAIIIPFATVSTIIVSSIQGFKIVKYKVVVKELFEPLLRLILLVVFLIMGLSLWGALYSYLITAIVSIPLSWFYLTKVFPPIKSKKVIPDFKTRKILGFSWPLMIVQFFSHSMLWIDTLMLGFFESPQLVGIYGAAHRTVLLGSIARTSFNSIFAPIISDLYNRNEFTNLENYFKTIAKWIFSINLGAFLFLILFAEKILGLFGSQFIHGTSSMIVLSIGWIVYSSAGSIGEMITMSGRSKLQLINMFSVLIINIIMNFVLIPKYGLIGAAISTSATMIIYTFIVLSEILSILKMHPFRKDFFKPVLSGTITVILTIMIRQLTKVGNFISYFPIVSIVLGGIVFFVLYIAMLKLCGFDSDDKIIIQKLKSLLKGEIS